MPRASGDSEFRPLVTLTTDFGTTDFYVAAMKAVLIRRCPAVRLIDVTHEIPRHDILCGAINLERAIDAFPPGAVHLAVVDPGVGTGRRLLVLRINAQTVVCPDNGLITWAWRRIGRATAHELTWRPPTWSDVFHGRDILAPAAAMLANGTSVEKIARPIDDPVLLNVSPATSLGAGGCVIHIDQFGNAMTNIGLDSLTQGSPVPNTPGAERSDAPDLVGERQGRAERERPGNLVELPVRAAGVLLGTIRRTYGDVAPGEPLALIGSSGLLEVAVRDGSAAANLGLRVGDPVRVISPESTRGSP